MSQKSLEKRFGQSPVFIAATFMEQGGIPPTTNPASLLKEAIHVISCGYEDKTEWGKEVSKLNTQKLVMHMLQFPYFIYNFSFLYLSVLLLADWMDLWISH